jgi:hypothetical protein
VTGWIGEEPGYLLRPLDIWEEGDVRSRSGVGAELDHALTHVHGHVVCTDVGRPDEEGELEVWDDHAEHYGAEGGGRDFDLDIAEALMSCGAVIDVPQGVLTAGSEHGQFEGLGDACADQCDGRASV